MILADACAIIVFLGSPNADSIMPVASHIMREQEIAVIPTTVWEITRKVAMGKLPRLWGNFPSLTLLLQKQRYIMHTIGWEDAEAANHLPEHHKDPMDRLLIATALRSNATVITNDDVFRQYGVATVW